MSEDLISRQPEITKRTAETEQNIPNGELISKKAAIDTVQSMYKRCDTGDITDYRDMMYEAFMVLPSVQEQRWIPVTERLPENAEHPGELCPRYLVMTPYGTAEGWYRPYRYEDGGRWYALLWFMDERFEKWNINLERGDVPKVVEGVPVLAWTPLPEPYKEEK